MSNNEPSDSSSEEPDQRSKPKKKKRLLTPKTRARLIVAAGPSQGGGLQAADSELLDFRNRVSLPPRLPDDLPLTPPKLQPVSSEYDASCESLDIRTSEGEQTDAGASEATLTPRAAGLRCQESVAADSPREDVPAAGSASPFDTGYLASSDSMSTSEMRAVMASYTQNPDVAQWSPNRNPEIRVHHQIVYDRVHSAGPALSLRASDVTAPPANATHCETMSEQARLSYRELGPSHSGGSLPAKREPDPEPERESAPRAGSDIAISHAYTASATIIARLQTRLHELDSDAPGPAERGPTPARRRSVPQRFALLSDEEVASERPGSSKTAGSERTGSAQKAESIRSSRGRRRRRAKYVPHWLLTDHPSDESLFTVACGRPSAQSLGQVERQSDRQSERHSDRHSERHSDRFSERHSDRHSERQSERQSDRFSEQQSDQLSERFCALLTDRPAGRRASLSSRSETETEPSDLLDVRAEGGDRFVDAVLWRLQGSLRPGTFRELRDPPAAARRVTSSSDESELAASSRVHFQDRVLVRPLARQPPRRSVALIRDYEDALRDGNKEAGEADGQGSVPVTAGDQQTPPKPKSGWRKLLCCVRGGGGSDDPSGGFVTLTPSQELRQRRRRRVKKLPVKELDPDVTNDELSRLHALFDAQQELARLSDAPDSETCPSEPTELSDPDSDAEPCFADFLKACGLSDAKIDDYLKYYKAEKALLGVGHGDWAGVRSSPDGRAGSDSDADDLTFRDARLREKELELQRRRRQRRDLQRALEAQRDLEVEAQLRRALETQRDLVRQRGAERELAHGRETSEERAALRREERLLERELMRRLLAELERAQERAQEQERRRSTARLLEEELIARLQVELQRQRERSAERRERHESQRREEDAGARELSTRIDELRRRIEENGAVREREAAEEQERLRLLEELLSGERRRMAAQERGRLMEQEQEAAERARLAALEQRSEEEVAQGERALEQTSRQPAHRHEDMKEKLTVELRRRELLKRKLISLEEIENTNPRLFRLAKVMEEVTDDRGCIALEYVTSSGILKKDSKTDGELPAAIEEPVDLATSTPKDNDALDVTPRTELMSQNEEAEEASRANTESIEDVAGAAPSDVEGEKEEARSDRNNDKKKSWWNCFQKKVKEADRSDAVASSYKADDASEDEATVTQDQPFKEGSSSEEKDQISIIQTDEDDERPSTPANTSDVTDNRTEETEGAEEAERTTAASETQERDILLT